MQVYGLQSSIWKNRLRLVYLMSLIPLFVLIVIALYSFFLNEDFGQGFIDTFAQTSFYLLPVVFLWTIIGVFLEKNIIFSFTGAKEITRMEKPEIYNIVENLCISRGLPIPKIAIIDDSSMNAFATGWSPKKSWVVFSQGLIDKLNKEEIEAVSGHELTHIINGDVKNMVIINVFIGAIGTIGYHLMKMSSGSSSSSKKGGNPLVFLGLLLYVLSIIILPLINLAISRKKELLADAGSVEITKNSLAMISALEKISQDSVIEKITKQSSNIASMFISNPKEKPRYFASIRGLFSTHPPIEERIELLKKY
ncbi:M48 family metallopeptidase [Candidatus Gracilibacteria bacterium]|nr:M48 family metallopeptidase [Candidatus Gracilibacteria bacterium]NUJ99238.1 M48 family metallopeptidase [Candidatus Gracilibacteria bacterium]